MILRATLLLALLACASPSMAEVEALIAQAQARDLARHPEWRRLLHIDERKRRPHSRADSRWWFLAETGKHDPAAELAATLRAFFDTSPREPHGMAAQCFYRGRLAFLGRQLRLDTTAMPQLACPRYAAWRESLAAERVTLVFPDAYLNNPSSMFGHTLLRLDDAEGEHPLLAYAVNFAAMAESRNGVAFAYKGLTGGYPGRFGIQPYYDKVRAYARVENRDLWEYRLNLDPAAIDRMLAHLWELRGVDFDYYFLDENCSFQLLALLAVARPDLPFLDGFWLRAIPADTLRRVQALGLIEAEEYRPALRTQLDHRLGQLDEAEARAFAELALRERPLDDLAAAPPRSQARLTSLLHDWLYYRHRTGGLSRDQALPRARAALAHRARVEADDGFAPVPMPAVAPQRGHRTQRMRLGFGNNGFDSRVLLGWRPAFHDLLDPVGGYVPGAQIDFLDLDLALRPSGLRLERLRVLDIVSIAPRSRLFPHWSWRVGGGAAREAGRPGLRWQLDGGPGVAFGSRLMGYLFALGEFQLSRELDKGYSVGAGGEAGVRWHLGQRYQLLLRARAVARASARDRQFVEIGQQARIAADWALRLVYGFDDVTSRGYARAAIQRYF